jgi:hypothetical protein
MSEVTVLRPRAAAVPELARSSAEAAVQARRLAGPAASAEQAAELPPGEPLARDATVVPQQAVGAAWDAAEELQQEVAAWDAAAEPQQEAAARVGAAVPQQAAAEPAGVEAAVRQREARGAAALLRGAAPDVRVARRRAALPSAVPWVFRRGLAPPWPAPPPAGQLARAMERSRIAT